MRPPQKLDGADDVLWAWLESEPFFFMPYSDGSGTIALHGLAICRYAKTGTIYRFSCTAKWEVANDSTWSTIDRARRGESAQYDVRAVQWIPL